MHFVDVPSVSRKLLDEFLGGHFSKTQGKPEFFELDKVNVEMEEPAGVSVTSRQRSAYHRAGTAVMEEVATPSPAGRRRMIE